MASLAVLSLGRRALLNIYEDAGIQGLGFLDSPVDVHRGLQGPKTVGRLAN